MSRRSGGSDDETADTTDVTTTSHTSSVWKVLGELADAGATGVLGHNSATSGAGSGVEGVTDSSGTDSAGVRGEATAGSGSTYGVAGYNNSTDFSAAVYGAVTASSNASATNGVYGYDPTENGAGVYGFTDGPGKTYGVYAHTQSADGYALYADGDSKTEGNHEITGDQTVGTLGASVYLSTSQTIPDDGRNTVEFDGTVVDDRNEWNNSGNYVFTCATDGDYHVSTSVEWQGNFPAGTEHNVYVRVNSSDKARRTQSVDNDTYSGILDEHVCKTLRGLSAGDEIEVQVSQTSGGSEDLGTGEAETYLTVDKIG